MEEVLNSWNLEEVSLTLYPLDLLEHKHPLRHRPETAGSEQDFS